MNLLVLPFALATYVVSCGWLHSARKAACVISPGVPHARSWLWVWLGWWVPVVSFWFPFQVVRDVRRASVVRDAAAIGPWWALWLTLMVLSLAVRGLTPTARPPRRRTAARTGVDRRPVLPGAGGRLRALGPDRVGDPRGAADLPRLTRPSRGQASARAVRRWAYTDATTTRKPATDSARRRGRWTR